ncbi:hypothetical protein BW731_06865 [Vagococcus martis]|uniref:Uncharacterized protein n=1 Tax=Vagococcus martis TaxID=1768210 RepID=A0A1V4DI56_9ENTE|nr:hypothetical protein [Vagococcus martis]OPF87910.1 hypothetical protein BW731_06865 [Vagococcus martis]
MKHKELDELYRENTSRYTNMYNILFKLDVILFPFLLVGVFLGNDSVQLYVNLLIAILTILQFILFSLDTCFRIKKGKQREKRT